MKLENVDIAKLRVGDLPKFDKCPCELCDDGCFDRAGNKHHPECRRKPPQRSKLSLATRCPLSHYQGTFLPPRSSSGKPIDHRRHLCPPAPDNEIITASKNVPMSSISSQREHYPPPPPPPDMTKKRAVKSAKQIDHLSLSRIIPMATQTHYQTEYVEKPVFPKSLRALKNPIKDSEINITEPSAAMSSQTTARAHFKSWELAPTRPFSEMPAVVGHVLFPGTDRNFDTTSASNFIPFQNVTQTKPIVRLDLSDNFKTSGTMDLRTNYRQDYVVPELPSKRKAPKSAKERSTAEEKVNVRRPMNGISQTSFDFRPYEKQRPTLPVDTEPFLSQITLGNSLRPAEKDSQYRLDYPGHDTNQHPREPVAAPKDYRKPYMAPIEKMDTLTVSQRDFVPIDIASLPRIRIIPLKSTLSLSDQKGPMENMSMSRYHYQPYESPTLRRQYGEFNSSFYVPPLDKFQGTTTTGEAYQGRSGQPARAYIPEVKMIDQNGEQNHNTNYRVDYPPHGLSLCAAKAYTIAQNKPTTTATPISAQ